ncbi:RICIN domain-containing protein [Paenarthrobacter sp. NPDC056912]|uniref:RICIN domain-containing protein n=1 Tax=Paenarthrobacter sp. NPDC056912 TaxID=3345965 RepID=UPI00366EB6FC
MALRKSFMVAAVPLAIAALAGIAPPTGAAVPQAVPAGTTFTVSVGATASGPTATDTPAFPFIDKNGSYYHQQSAALYGASEKRQWDFYTGTTMDDATKSSTVSGYVNPANSQDRNNDTTWRCNNSPTGLTSTNDPSGTYSQKNFCDLAGVWVDPDTGDWYGLVHNEFTGSPFGEGSHYDAIDRAVSKDQGKTWSIADHIITSPFSTTRNDTSAFPNQTYYYGDGDQRLLVDHASGYFYVYYGSRVINKTGGWQSFQSHVARAPISAKMSPNSWQKWYNGTWTEPGVGGKESSMLPVTGAGQTGYATAATEYNPANTGTAQQQIAAGQLQPTSPLFVMDVAYNAYLGLYIGQPQAVDQSGNAPQQFYATDDLTKQQWTLIGDTGAYHTKSWYRWFLDSANKTSNQIIGKDFRSYCYFCDLDAQPARGSEYVPVTITSSAAPAAPVDVTKLYSISNGGGRLLAQASSGSATTSLAAGTSGNTSWQFDKVGDGSYTITNTATSGRLGVPTSSPTNRAWGTQPTVTAAATGSAAVGQQWWVIKETSAANNAPTGTVKLVNRYSGLVLNLSSTSTRLAETTALRVWNDTSGNSVGGGRTAGEQTLSLAVVGAASSTDLTGNRTLKIGANSLDVPNHSTVNGTQLATWTTNNGNNQLFSFTRQSNGTYEIKGVESGLCLDVDGGSSAAGAKIIQWTCTGGLNQRWTLTKVSGGAYTVSSAQSGLLLTAASSTAGALVSQQSSASSPLQQWVIG